MAATYSGTNEELYTKVRDILGAIDEEFIKDDNIEAQKSNIVQPFIDRNIDETLHDQNDIDRAILGYTAYRAFSAVPLMSTISGGGLTANLSPSQYRSELREMASVALAGVGLSIPEENSRAAFAKRTDGMLRD